MEWQRLESADAVAQAACETILQAAEQAISARGGFHLVLAGGSTPAQCYRLLARSSADWQHWHIYFGDERCLPWSDPERNSRMAAEALTGKVSIPAGQIHPIPAELGAEQAARLYTEIIRSVMPFDLVLLGMGEDGHTASLFPGQQHPQDALVVPVHNAPKPPAERVSLTAVALGSCRQLLVLVTGPGKRQALREWRAGSPLPVAEIIPKGSATLLLDSDAAPDPMNG
jgi:6-phosphogluconolactonase